jgi:hypothetical protein
VRKLTSTPSRCCAVPLFDPPRIRYKKIRKEKELSFRIKEVGQEAQLGRQEDGEDQLPYLNILLF